MHGGAVWVFLSVELTYHLGTHCSGSPVHALTRSLGNVSWQCSCANHPMAWTEHFPRDTKSFEISQKTCWNKYIQYRSKGSSVNLQTRSDLFCIGFSNLLICFLYPVFDLKEYQSNGFCSNRDLGIFWGSSYNDEKLSWQQLVRSQRM